MTTIDEYLATVTDSQKNSLQRVRDIIKQAVPEVNETISYKMPAFTYGGKSLVLFSAFKNHMSLFGDMSSVETELEGKYTLSHKGTVQFTEANQLPEDIIVKIVLSRKAQIDSGDYTYPLN
ncbi:iron chaperone [soil metagenome]